MINSGKTSSRVPFGLVAFALLATACSGGAESDPNGAAGDESTASEQARSGDVGHDEVGTTAEALNTTALVGKVVAYASTSGSNTVAHQFFGAGTFLANAGDLAKVGNDATRLLEVGPSMRVRACTDEGDGVGSCEWYENLTGGNRTFTTAAGISRLDVRPLLVGYRDANFGGVAEGFEIGRHEVARGRLSVVGNDTITSLRIAPGLTARLCSDDPEKTVGGTCQTFTGSQAQIAASLDNRTSWIEVRPVTVLFQDANLTGTRQRFGAGRFTVASLTEVGNDTVTSAFVPEGVITRLCSDDPNATVGGVCTVFSKSSVQLASNLDNRTSWLESRQNVILAPLNDESDYRSTDPYVLRGFATSPDGGEITGTNLRWTSSRDGFLGTGNTLPVHLSFDSNNACGGTTHTITLQATDSRGVVTTTRRNLSFFIIC